MIESNAKYYLYVQTKEHEYFLVDNEDFPEWCDISELSTKNPKCYKTLERANEAMRCLVKPFATVITEVHLWGSEE